MTHPTLTRRSLLQATAAGAAASALPVGVLPAAHADGGVVTAPVVIATLAAAKILSDLLAGINNALTTSAQVHARAASGGPDDDDLGSRATSDLVNTFLETDLEAWTSFDTGGSNLGPNRGSPHIGIARIHLTYTGGQWVAVQGDRYATAIAKADTTPAQGSPNTTAAAAVATFAHNGAIVKTYEISDQDEGAAFALGSASKRVTPAEGDEDLSCRSSGALLWSTSSFVLSDAGDDLVRVVHPDDGRRLKVFHTAVQREASPLYRSRYDAGLDPMLTAELSVPESETDAALGTGPLSAGDRVDFTLTGLDVRFRPLELPREGRSDVEIIKAYLASPGSKAMLVPEDAQAGFVLPDITVSPAGAGAGLPAGTLLADEGGYGDVDEDRDEPAFDDADMVGVLFETTGSLTDAINLSVTRGGNATADEVGALGAGDSYELSCTFAGGATSQHVTREVSTAGGSTFERTFGATPADTAMFVAQRYFDGAQTVFIATEADFPDALAGAAAAGMLNAPILFVQRDQIPDATFSALEQLAPQQAFILGGPAAISESVEQTLRELVGQGRPGDLGQGQGQGEGGVERVFGATRFETAVQIALRFFSQGRPWHVATGDAFPDALAGAAPAISVQGPVILVRRNSIPDEVFGALEQLAPQGIFVLGGPNAISDKVVQQFSEFTQTFRVAGDTRFTTATQIARGAFPKATEAFLVPGGSFHEALIASPIAGMRQAPVLLSPGSSVGPDALDAMNDLPVQNVNLISVGENLHPSLEDELSLHGPC